MKPRSILIKMDNNASFDRFGEWEESRLGPKLFFSLILGRSSRIVPCLLFTSLVQSEHKINYASRVPCASVSQDSTKVFTGMPRVVLPEPASRAIPFLSAACWGDCLACGLQSYRVFQAVYSCIFCRARRAATQPSFVTWCARPTASAPDGTSLVMQEPAPI